MSGSGYRPICDTWILARPKVAYYGAYPAGFLERARALLGVHITDPVLHVCGGMVRAYPFKGGFGPNDRTLDLDPNVAPDYLQSASEPYPGYTRSGSAEYIAGVDERWIDEQHGWPAILADPPYTDEDHQNYEPSTRGIARPTAGQILKLSLAAVRVGGRVGILDYIVPSPPPPGAGYDVKFVAKINVWCGFNNRERAYSVWERRA